jgi:N-formylglutamate amidohydrolase
MQKNALKNKNNGIIVAAYNKMAEVHNKQSQRTEYKQYIMDFYGNPQKSLHRLEVRVNAANITKYCDSHKIEMTEEILFDEHLLTAMYYEFLSRVLSFTHVSTSKTGKQCLREQISWDTIFCNKKI